MRVLVTGCTGLLGSALVPWLESRGHVVRGVARGASGEGAADLAEPAAAQRVLDDFRPDSIVNLAALANVDECERDPALAYRMNSGLVLNLVRWIGAARGGCRLVQISTDQLYNGSGPHTEAHIAPLNYYGFSKGLAEEYVGRVDGISLRTNFFGRSALPGRASLSDWIIGSVRAGRAITVFDDVWFSPLSIHTVVHCVEAVLHHPARGAFNLGSRNGMSKADFAFRLTRAADLQSATLSRGSIGDLEQVARRPRDMRMDVSAFERVLGVQLPTLEEEIATVGRGYAHAASQ